MALPPLFSRRKRIASGVAGDVYSYDSITNKVRVQIVHIIVDGLERVSDYSRNRPFWSYIVETMRKEKGVFRLGDKYENWSEEYCNWLLTEKEIDYVLDGVELAMHAISGFKGEYQQDEFVSLNGELNARFDEAGIGFQFVSGKIIQIDQQIIHKEIVLPALQLLHDKRFAGGNNEYLDAHQFYRNGDFESCLIECGKALESVLKVLGTERKWGINPNDTASKLIAAAFSLGFVPMYMQAQFTALRSVLESGTPVVRNKMAGHGAGGQVRQVDRHLAAYQLHQTAAAIVFLIEHDKFAP